MKTHILSIIAVCTLFLFASCSQQTTNLTESRYYPENKVTMNKILVVGVSDNIPVRNLYEQDTKKHLKSAGMQAMGSLEAMPGKVKIDEEAFETYFKAQNIDAILITHVIDREKMPIYDAGQEYNNPGRYTNNFYAYYYYTYDRTSEPGHFEVAEKLVVETNLYAVDDGALIWSCQSESFHKDNAQDILRDLTKLLVKEMKEDGVL